VFRKIRPIPLLTAFLRAEGVFELTASAGRRQISPPSRRIPPLRTASLCRPM